MKFSQTSLSVALVAVALAAPAPNEKRTVPALYLAGDSTMALGGGGTGTQGWGEYIKYSVKDFTIYNDAKAGTSARSYTDQGRFTTIIDAVVSGDTVIIEFGHNDGGSLSTTDNLRTDCYGSGSETCVSPTTGAIVQTYVTYLTNAAKAIVAKGAKVIICSPTPDNVCETGTCSYTAPRFTAYGKQVVTNVGTGASFVDHGAYVAREWISLGATVVNSYFPNDHTHPSPIGSAGVAQQFVKAALCAGNAIDPHFKNTTASIAGVCA